MSDLVRERAVQASYDGRQEISEGILLLEISDSKWEWEVENQIRKLLDVQIIVWRRTRGPTPQYVVRSVDSSKIDLGSIFPEDPSSKARVSEMIFEEADWIHWVLDRLKKYIADTPKGHPNMRSFI